MKRLVKIAKELNVGTSTIVEHLNKCGFDIDNKPTAKVTDDMYKELLKEFQSSLKIKERADKIQIGTRPASSVTEQPVEKAATPPPPPPAENVVNTPKVTPPPVVEQPKAQKPKDTVVEQPKPTTPKVEEPKVTAEESKKEEPKKEEPSSPSRGGLKILGKIDLDNRNFRKKPAPKKKGNPSGNKEQQVQQQPNKGAEPKKEVAPKVQTPTAKPPVQEKEMAKPPKKEQTPVQNKQEVKKEQSNVSPKQEQKTAPKQEQKPTPKKEDAPVAKASSDDKDKVITAKDSVIRASSPELRGLKVLGKIDTSKLKPQRKKTTKDNNNRSGGDNADARKKRRKRVKKTPTGNNNQQGQNNSNNNNRSQGDNNNRGGQGGNNNRGGQGGNNNRGGGHNRGGQGGNNHGGRRRGNNNHRGRNQQNPRHKKEEVKEISQKEIDEKIKATMAKIKGGSGKKRQKLRREHRDRHREKEELQLMQDAEASQKLEVTEFVSVSELASLLDVNAAEVIMACMNLGVIVSINQRLDAEVIELVASEFNREVEFLTIKEMDDEEVEEIVDSEEDLEPRSPIVTVMGHVDHGKTSLLDYIRSAKVAEGEAGGITQHIGAYEIRVGEENKRITFLDTPGHEAFTAMRARGAKVTDIAIIIIAADDNIMPQTKEAISHAQAADVPIIFAINKIDKPGADPNRIKQELAGMNMLIEEWGGDIQSEDISAKMGTNIDSLLEKVLLQAEMLELKANPNRLSVGTILEASLDKGRGYVATALVQNGTLNIGDPIVAGANFGKIKAMFNESGQKVKQAGPSQPVVILGLDGAPQAGERFKEFAAEKDAKSLASKRAQILREQTTRATKRISLDEIGRRIALGSFKELKLIVKGDVDGSIQALTDSLEKLSMDTVQVNVLHKAVGQIIESDVMLASASDAIIIGFQVRPSAGARRLAEAESVQIKTYSVIYDIIDEVKAAMEGLLEPTKEEKILGNVRVRETFKISRVGTIAGCYVEDGMITRNSHIRVIRNGIVVFPIKENVVGEITSLKRFKEDVKEVKSGFECGLSVKNFNDIKVDDEIEAYEIVEVQRKL